MTVSLDNDGRVAIGFCLDESGSMSSCLQATISGFNEWVNQLRGQDGKTNMTVTKFSSRMSGLLTHRPLVENVDITKVPELTMLNYAPGGNTPLFDAIGYTIKKLESWLSEQSELWTVMFVIQTDGEENSSREFTRDDVFKLIQRKEADGWKFLYLGADQDEMTAAATGSAIGMSTGSTMTYDSTSSNQALYAHAQTVSGLRTDSSKTSPQLLTETRKGYEDALKAKKQDEEKDKPKEPSSTPNF